MKKKLLTLSLGLSALCGIGITAAAGESVAKNKAQIVYGPAQTGFKVIEGNGQRPSWEDNAQGPWEDNAQRPCEDNAQGPWEDNAQQNLPTNDQLYEGPGQTKQGPGQVEQGPGQTYQEPDQTYYEEPDQTYEEPDQNDYPVDEAPLDEGPLEAWGYPEEYWPEDHVILGPRPHLERRPAYSRSPRPPRYYRERWEDDCPPPYFRERWDDRRRPYGHQWGPNNRPHPRPRWDRDDRGYCPPPRHHRDLGPDRGRWDRRYDRRRFDDHRGRRHH